MSTENLRKLWLILVLTLLLFTFSAHGQTQGADFALKINVLVGLVFPEGTDPVIVSLWGIILTSMLLILAMPVSREFALKNGPTWRHRFPFRLWDEDPSQGLAAKIQVLAFGVFMLWPVFALGHFWSKLYKYGVICTNETPRTQIPETFIFDRPINWHLSGMLSENFHVSGTGCAKSAAYFPVIQPFAMVLLSAFALWLWWNAIDAVFYGDRGSPPANSASLPADLE